MMAPWCEEARITRSTRGKTAYSKSRTTTK